MITFTNLGQYGRLGNQLFQYAVVKSVSLERGLPLQLPDLSDRTWHGQNCLLPQLQLSYEPLMSPPSHIYYERTPHQFDDGVFSVEDGTNFMGFFQHPSYFDKYRNVFIKEFSASQSVQDQATSILSNYTNPTSIHIRQGDYLDYAHPDYHRLVLEYINHAVEDVGKDTDFLVFTGGSRKGNEDRDSDFLWCKENLRGDNFHFMEGNSELLDFELIKKCTHNITAWDSTFSWWASYLNEGGGTVYCNTKYQKLPLYLYTQNWRII
jgi:hypothetical protein